MQATTDVAEPGLEAFTTEAADERSGTDQPLPRVVAYSGIAAVSAMLWWMMWQTIKFFG